jgi:mitochondrial import receptor subunit TOM70
MPAALPPSFGQLLPMSSDDSFVDRVSSFVSENRRGIVIGVAAAAVAVGGVAYYVASSRGLGGPADEESLMSGKKKDKRKKKHKKSVKDKDGPILEERKPKVDEESDDGWTLYPCYSLVVCSLVLANQLRP